MKIFNRRRGCEIFATFDLRPLSRSTMTSSSALLSVVCCGNGDGDGTRRFEWPYVHKQRRFYVRKHLKTEGIFRFVTCLCGPHSQAGDCEIKSNDYSMLYASLALCQRHYIKLELELKLKLKPKTQSRTRTLGS